MNKIYISYSHKDKVWKDRLVEYFKTLEMADVLSLRVDRMIQPGSSWETQIDRAIEDSKIAVLLISADFLSSDFIIKKEIPRLLVRRTKEALRIIPILIKPCAWRSNEWLSKLQVYPKDGIPLALKTKFDRDMELENFTIEVKTILSQYEAKTVKPAIPLGEYVSLYRLPVTGEHLFGREKELKQLDEAWIDSQTDIISLVAWGGVGKTALVNQWLNRMNQDNYRGAKKVFGWSFYSQGAAEGKLTSADEFFQETLAWFGDSHPESGSSVDKGRRLARLVRKHNTLLILDGLEPLQYPPGEVTGLDGRLKDPGLSAFLKEYSVNSGEKPGLCVITTREPITDLKQRLNYGVKEILLEHLSADAGVLLLKSLGVAIGLPLDFQKAVMEYNGHALALTLLGLYIKNAFEGDIRRRDEIPRLEKERHKGFHAQRVMEAYEKWFGPSPERDILFLLGLFDRPVEKEVIKELIKKPIIPGVTDRLLGILPEDWQYALTHLREARLLASDNPRKKDTLDCHPLVREHFGAKLFAENPDGWQKAHLRLYHYFKNLPKKELPDSLLEMEPLFAAIAHGCKAGLHEEVRIEVFWKRIWRGEEAYLIKKLGAFGSDLAILSHFFAVPWSQPIAGLTKAGKAVVLNWAAFGLRAVGRLQEAIQPMKAGLEMQAQQNDWKNAASAASNLSELLLTLGDISGAVEIARQSVTHADSSGDEDWKFITRTTLADALHKSGAKIEAEKWFLEAEAKQKKIQPEFPFLYSLQGYRFCDLLLENQKPGQANKVITRAEHTLEWVKQQGWLLDISLDQLTLGRALTKVALEKNQLGFSQPNNAIANAKIFLEQAITGLRESGYQYYLPLGLLARAEYYRHTHEYARAHDDLNEARDIAELGSMKLLLCDYHLEARQLCLAEGKEQEALKHKEAAAQLIEETGYGRRRKLES